MNITGDITISKVETRSDRAIFESMKHDYFIHDLFPNCDLGEGLTGEDKEYFLSSEYEEQIEQVCNRDKDKAYRVLFLQDTVPIGFCLYCTYLSEDSKCFILEYAILPDYRNNGIGKKCFDVLVSVTRAEGALYYALNVSNKRNMRFWESLGFVLNGYDEYGSVLMIKK